MTRTLAICADDFGLAPGISMGIVRLARARRITAISCITNSPHWEEDSKLLLDLPESIELGLHLNFTEGIPLSARLSRHWPRLPSLPKVVALAHIKMLPRAQMRNEVHSQLAAFNRSLGRPPHFIDGHQHVHHLAGLREIILDMVEHVQPLPAVRSTGRVLGPGFAVKRWLIERTGGRALAQALSQRVFNHNPALLGVYDFRQTDYRALVKRWLLEVPRDGALMFCHPGEASPGDGARDPILPARLRELDYLGSADFRADLAAADVVLGPVWQTIAPQDRGGRAAQRGTR